LDRGTVFQLIDRKGSPGFENTAGMKKTELINGKTGDFRDFGAEIIDGDVRVDL
jgi:hypothetical protein